MCLFLENGTSYPNPSLSPILFFLEGSGRDPDTLGSIHPLISHHSEGHDFPPPFFRLKTINWKLHSKNQELLSLPHGDLRVLKEINQDGKQSDIC